MNSLNTFVIASVALAIAGVAAAQGSPGTPCDLDLIRTHAEESYPGYGAEVRRDERGVLTLRFTPREGEGAFAIALRAVGTQLSTSMMTVTGIGDAERGRLAEPVTTWWRHAELQRTLAACSVGGPDSAEVDLAAAARAALQPEVFHQRWRVALLLGVAWIVLAGLLIVELLQCARSSAERLALVGLFACSFAFNKLLCVGGPGNTRLSFVAVHWGDALDLRWGPAPVELFRLLTLVLGRIDDVHIQAVNLTLSSLVPALTFAIVVALGVGRGPSLLATFMAAAHPFSIAFSADLSRQPTYLFAAFGSILSLVGFLKHGGIGAIGAFVLGTILAVTSRPEGGHVLVVAAAILLFGPANYRRRITAGVVFALLGALALVYVRTVLEYGAFMTGATPALWVHPTALLWTIILSPDFTPLAWIVVWGIGLLIGVRTRAARVTIATLVGLHIAWSATGLYASVVGYERNVSSARYESVLLLPFAMGTALFVERVLALPARLALAIAALVGMLTLVTYPRAHDTLLRPATADDEYRFLRRHAQRCGPARRSTSCSHPWTTSASSTPTSSAGPCAETSNSTCGSRFDGSGCRADETPTCTSAPRAHRSPTRKIVRWAPSSRAGCTIVRRSGRGSLPARSRRSTCRLARCRGTTSPSLRFASVSTGCRPLGTRSRRVVSRQGLIAALLLHIGVVAT